jgi:ATP-dependent helicase Lhr and Lhr-like helicase
LSEIADPAQRIEDFYLRLRAGLTPQMWKAVLDGREETMCLPDVDSKALEGLKFSDALPRHIAEATLAQRLADLEGARITLSEPHRWLL